MLTTRQINDMNHEVSHGATIVGYITQAWVHPKGRPTLGVGLWGFTASKEGEAAGYADTEWRFNSWKQALSAIAQAAA